MAKQMRRGRLQPAAADVFRRRFIKRQLEDAMKMKSRKVRHVGQLLQGQEFVQVRIDMVEDAVEAGGVFV